MSHNRDGHPCPPWCVTDHDRYGFHASGAASGYAPEFHRWTVRAVRYPSDRYPHIEVAAAGATEVSLCSAVDLAGLIEQLAAATPEQHRVLAAAIRRACALAAGAHGKLAAEAKP